jgi:hypothetical protein
MHFDALENILGRLANDAAINQFYDVNFPGIDPFYTVGLKPDYEAGTGVPADCFPYIAVSPLSEDRLAVSKNVTLRISIMYGVNNDERQGRVFVGLRQVSQLGLLILEALLPDPLSTGPAVSWTGEAAIRSDAGLQHPYYEGEIIIPLGLRL